MSAKDAAWMGHDRFVVSLHRQDMGHVADENYRAGEHYLPWWKRSTIFSVMARWSTGDESTVEVDVVP